MAALRPELTPLILALALAAGCEPDVINTDKIGWDTGAVVDGGVEDGGSSTSGDGGSSSGDGGSTGPTSESDCEDGVDEDSDGVTDCEDPDCASFWACDLPDAVDYHTFFEFRGNTIECEWIGIEYDVDIDDCSTEASGRLNMLEGPQACPDCDRSYSGPITYGTDTCSELLGVAQAPDASFGLVFLAEDQRELWAPDEAGAWFPLVTLTRQDKLWTNTTSEDIWADPEDCDNGDQNLGNLTVTVDFRDL